MFEWHLGIFASLATQNVTANIKSMQLCFNYTAWAWIKVRLGNNN